MGGGLTFLNKKTWHPGRMQNQERLWKAEEEAAKEARSLAELRKKIEDERGREELKQAAIAGGHQKAADRLDWMYSGGMTAKAEADKRNEEAMLGAAPVTVPGEEQQVSRLEQATQLPSFYADDTPAAANETWARLHSDPLFAIKQQEHSARKQVVKNPAQMLAIKQQVDKLKQEAMAKKMAKKQAKEAKKQKMHEKKKAAALPKHHLEDRHDTGRDHAAKRQRCSRSQSRSPAHRHHSSHHHSNGHRHAHSGAERDSVRHHDAAASRHHADGAAAQGSGVAYGLNTNAHQGYDRSGQAAATRRRLEEAARAKEEAEKAAALARGQRRDYQAGRLTAEEKAARLAEMTGNAADHDTSRSSRLKNAASKDAADANATDDNGRRHHSDAAKFMKSVTKEVYGTVGDADSLQDRITRRKYYIERGGPEDRAAFRR